MVRYDGYPEVAGLNPVEPAPARLTVTEALIVAGAIGMLAWWVIPQFTQAAYDGRVGSLSVELHTLRTQIEQYRIDHGGRYPTAADFVMQMTRPTRADGTLCTRSTQGPWYGPYLREIPVNPCTGGNRVGGRIGDDIDWYYDERTGRIVPSGARSGNRH